jgi:hypothetical protein
VKTIRTPREILIASAYRRYFKIKLSLGFTRLLRLILYPLAVAAMPAVVHADIFTFGGPDFSWYHDSSSGLATPNHIWAAGDYWEQSFSTSNLEDNEFDFHLAYNDNSLGQTLNLEVLVNGTWIGEISIAPGQSGSDVSFEAMSIGPTYDIRLEALNTIPAGQNAVSLDTSGLSTASIALVPEPGCLALVSAGLAGLVVTMRSKSRG